MGSRRILAAFFQKCRQKMTDPLVNRVHVKPQVDIQLNVRGFHKDSFLKFGKVTRPKVYMSRVSCRLVRFQYSHFNLFFLSCVKNIHTGGSLRFHRADLQRALLGSMCGQLHLSHRLVSYEETDEGIQLQFQDGKTASCDLLIGMDGIKSVVRKCFLIKQGRLDSPSIYPFWTGSFAYRGLVPIDKLAAAFPGHRVFHTPMMVGSTLFVPSESPLTYYLCGHQYCGKFKVCLI